jgi:transglutaminase-like putative cysteine protease
MKRGVLLIIVFLLSINIVFANDFYYNDNLLLHSTITNTIDVQAESSSYYVNYVKTQVSWFPQEDYRQELVDLNTVPAAEINDNSIDFTLNNPSIGEKTFVIDFNIQTSNMYLPVKKKIKFPIESISTEFHKYTRPTVKININDDIRSKAEELSAGKDDLYEVVFSLAEWVHDNIEYDLSTITSEATQSSSWVYNNREGVCDEITNLFISMCRSLGIPARFVSGIAYTNSELFTERWGAHGWAEVYFPDYGWVPFDVTYEQLGFVDSTHIKLKADVDSDKYSTSYEWQGKNIEVVPQTLDITAEPVNKGTSSSPTVSISLSPESNNVGFGSYNLIKANVKNLKGYYVAPGLMISRNENLKIIGDQTKYILLRPYEEKTLYWIVEVDRDLSPSYVYTFTIGIFSSRNESATTTFDAKSSGMRLDYDYLKAIVEQSEEGSKKPFNEDVSFKCDPNNELLYLNETSVVTCALENSGSAELQNLQICLEANCQTVNIKRNEGKSVVFEKDFSSIGLKTLMITAKNSLISKASFVTVSVLDEPGLVIKNLSYPSSMSFDDISYIEFTVSKSSDSAPKNVDIFLKHSVMEEDWFVRNLDHDQKFKLILTGGNLDLKDNFFVLNVTYEDERGEVYNIAEEFEIELVNANFWHKLLIIINKYSYKLKRFFDG